jgi:KipI family sensor histidine kinase inhibitor
MHIAPAGDRGLLVTLPGATSARMRAAADAIRAIDGVVAAIIGHESIYVIGSSDAAAVQNAVEASVASNEGPSKRHQIEVSFHESHALDLNDFLNHVGVSRDDFLSKIGSIGLSVRYLGFRAGFAYLEGWPAEWSMPRHATSRNVVPGGSFATAGSMAGFYPVDSPGGWNILGRTAAPLWDPLRDPPNLFAPGDDINIVVTEKRQDDRLKPVPNLQHGGESIADVLAPGQLTSIVGPPDWTRLQHGQTPGGAFDEEAAAIANAAAGNPPHAPLLECVLVGPKLRLRKKCRVVFCDGDLQVRSFESQEVDIGRIRGMRGYLAIEGGINEMRLRYADAPTVLKRGDSLWSAAPWRRLEPPDSKAAASRRTPKAIRVMRGPHDAPPLPERWEVTPQLNRVGVRLRPLERMDVKLPADLPSCGAQFGTLQWHADGSLMALGPDHPVTGGYLQPATVLSSERWKLAQLTPGDRVQLVAV